MIDCLLLGHFELPFSKYVDALRTMGRDGGAFRDVSLAYIEVDGAPVHSMDLLNRLRNGRADLSSTQTLHNADFLWPVITYLGTYLWRRGLSFDFVNLPHLQMGELRDKVSKNDIKVVAITTTLQVAPDAIIELIKIVRRSNSTARVVVGGPYIANLPKATSPNMLNSVLQYIGADIYVVSSEGEKALAEVVEAVKAGVAPSHVDNIYYRDGRQYIFTRTSVESNALADNMVNYGLFSGHFNEFITVRTAKSCPFSCAFCAFPSRAGRYSYLSVSDVERELNAIRDIGGVSTLTIIDDTFNVPKERFKEIMRMMIRNRYEFRWNSFFRSDHADETALNLMAEAGCEGVFLGAESGSDQQLIRMNKTSRRKDYIVAIKRFRELGIKTHASIIVGFPGETDETCMETMDFLAEARPDTFRAQLWYADVGTPIFTKRDLYHIEGSGFAWKHEVMDVQQACEWVESMYCDVTESVWLPQNGFEQWSTFYLQRKGMRFADIMQYLRHFRELKKAELNRARRIDVSYHMEQMRSLACFGKQGTSPGVSTQR